jgi:hypothetical protein
LIVGVAHRISAQHQSWEIEFPFTLSGDIRTVDITQFALETFVNDLVLLSRRQPPGILIVMLIDEIKKSWKGRAELKAQTAAVA